MNHSQRQIYSLQKENGTLILKIHNGIPSVNYVLILIK